MMTIITIMMIIDDDSNGICWIIIDDDNLGKEGHRFFCCHALVLPFLGCPKKLAQVLILIPIRNHIGLMSSIGYQRNITKHITAFPNLSDG